MPSAILLIAHGSRRREANQDLVDVARAVAARRPGEIVEIAYLELAEPDIPSGARRCVERGATDVSLLPYFLSPGAHVREDLTAFREKFATDYPGVRFRCCAPLGPHPGLVDVLLERLDEPEQPAGQATRG